MLSGNHALTYALLLSFLFAHDYAVVQSPAEAPISAEQAQDHKAEPPLTDQTILSDTLGVDFKPYLAKIMPITQGRWESLMPKDMDPPIRKKAAVKIRLSILPNGRLEPRSMVILGRSGDIALDRAAWTAILKSDYPPLPQEFKGPRLTLQILFQYNPKTPSGPYAGAPL